MSASVGNHIISVRLSLSIGSLHVRGNNPLSLKIPEVTATNRRETSWVVPVRSHDPPPPHKASVSFKGQRAGLGSDCEGQINLISIWVCLLEQVAGTHREITHRFSAQRYYCSAIFFDLGIFNPFVLYTGSARVGIDVGLLRKLGAAHLFRLVSRKRLYTPSYVPSCPKTYSNQMYCQSYAPETTNHQQMSTKVCTLYTLSMVVNRTMALSFVFNEITDIRYSCWTPKEKKLIV